MSAAQIELLIAIGTALVGLVAASGTLVWFVSEQFKNLRKEFWDGLAAQHNTTTARIDNIQKETSATLTEINREIWKIRVRNAYKDGHPNPEPDMVDSN